MMEVEIFREIPQNIGFEDTSSFYMDRDSSNNYKGAHRQQQHTPSSYTEGSSSVESSPHSYYSDFTQTANQVGTSFMFLIDRMLKQQQSVQ